MITMIRLAIAPVFAALAFAPNAVGLGGSLYAHVAYQVNSGSVDVTVVSNHSFSGTVITTCGTAVNDPESLNGWVFDQVAHQYIDAVGSVGTAAAGAGASCSITVLSGKKLLAEQSFVSA
jgi:hypothetical protein